MFGVILLSCAFVPSPSSFLSSITRYLLLLALSPSLPLFIPRSLSLPSLLFRPPISVPPRSTLSYPTPSYLGTPPLPCLASPLSIAASLLLVFATSALSVHVEARLSEARKGRGGPDCCFRSASLSLVVREEGETPRWGGARDPALYSYIPLFLFMGWKGVD